MVVKTITVRIEDGELQAFVDGVKKAGYEIEDLGKKGEKSGTRYSGALKKSSLVVQELDKQTGGLASSFLDVGDAIGKANLKLSEMRALMFAGIAGVAVAAAGAVVLYYEEIYDWIVRANVELERQVELSRQRQKTLEFELELLKRQAEFTKLKGENEQFVINRQKEKLKLLIEENGLELQKLKTIRDQLAARAAEITFGERIRGFLSGGVPGAATGSQEDAGRLKAIGDQIRENELALYDFRIVLEELENPNRNKKSKNSKAPKKERRGREQKINPITGESYDAERERIAGHFAEIFDLDLENKKALQESADAANEKLLTSEEYAQAKQNAIERQGKETRVRISREEAMAKRESFMMVADAAAAAAALAGQDTAVGKGLAVSATLISTYLTAQKAFESQFKPLATVDSPLRGTLAAAAAAASGLANARAIAGIKVPGASGFGSIGTSPSTPPTFNVVGNSPQNQLNQLIAGQTRGPIEAFVVESAVTSAQQLRRNKILSSSL